ncbi:MAG: hypothetical protein LBI34_00475 [Puniceicoccales bacterium]|jgi:hypothetical protein|nr:hypothetical protein [Puniceicoccales bacterium]
MSDLRVIGIKSFPDKDGTSASTTADAPTEPPRISIPISTRECYRRWSNELGDRGIDCPSSGDIQEFFGTLAPAIGPDGKLYFKEDEGLSAEEKEAHVRIDMLGALHCELANEIEDRMIELRRRGHTYVEVLDELNRSLDARATEKSAVVASDQVVAHTNEVDGATPPVQSNFLRSTRGQVAIIGGTAAASIGGAIIFGPFAAFIGVAFLPLFIFLLPRGQDE